VNSAWEDGIESERGAGGAGNFGTFVAEAERERSERDGGVWIHS
jgi:hypothetical protein